jgi:hypothetical protein
MDQSIENSHTAAQSPETKQAMFYRIPEQTPGMTASFRIDRVSAGQFAFPSSRAVTRIS